MGNAVFLGIVISLMFIIFGLFGTNIYISSQTSDPLISEMANEYLGISLRVLIRHNIFLSFEKLLQAGGHSGFSTIAQIIGAVANIILDPILIYGLLGFPKWA